MNPMHVRKIFPINIRPRSRIQKKKENSNIKSGKREKLNKYLMYL